MAAAAQMGRSFPPSEGPLLLRPSVGVVPLPPPNCALNLVKTNHVLSVPAWLSVCLSEGPFLGQVQLGLGGQKRMEQQAA